MAEKGTLGSLHPPGSGASNGVAMINGDDGSFHVAKTPRDNNGETLTEGNVIFYTLTPDGKHVDSITHVNSGPIGGTTDNPLGDGGG